MFGSNYLEALDKYIPDMDKKKNWTASDSVLTIFNSASPKECRDWASQQWMDNEFCWDQYVTESVWAIKDGGLIEDIMAKLKEKLAADPWVRGDPSRFTDHLSFLTMQNESKFERDQYFQEAREYLNAFSVGTVSIFGPGTADFWWPDTVGSAANAKWDKLSHRYFNILTQGNVHPWMRGSAPLGDMELRRGVSAKGNPWVDHHFADTGPNCFKMSMILTNLVIWQQFLCNMREVAMALGRIPSDDRAPRWISGSNRGLQLNPYYR